MKLNRTQLSRRAKKGWETRHRKYGNQKKSDFERTQIQFRRANVAGVGALATFAAPGTYRRTRYQSVWTRPNGQKIKLKGFNPDQLSKITPALDEVDRRVKPSLRPRLKSIKNQSGIGSGMYGGVSQRSSIRIRTAKLKHPGGAPLRRTNRLLGLIGHGIHADGKEATMGYIVSHELGHSFDAQGEKINPFGKFTNSVWTKGTGWIQGDRPTGAPTPGGLQGWSPPSSAKNYQAAAPWEDFAESFATALRPKEGMHDVDLSGFRGSYLRKHVFQEGGNKGVTKANIAKTNVFKSNKGKLAIGGAAAAAAGGYAVYRYKTDPKFNRWVNHKREGFEQGAYDVLFYRRH